MAAHAVSRLYAMTLSATLALGWLTACGGGGGGATALPAVKAWGAATLLGTNHLTDSSNQQVAIDASGNALAVWQQFDGVINHIWANRYTPSTGWGTGVLLETDSVNDAGLPKVAFDPSGNALAVWTQSDGTHQNIWANRFTAATSTWGTAVLIETDNAGDAYDPMVAFDGSGNALAVWYQNDGLHDHIRSNRYTAGTGWGAAAPIEANPGDYAQHPRIAISASGNALVVWHQNDGTFYNIWSNRYTMGTGWGTAVLIETGNAGHAINPQVAIDGTGNALAVWQQSDGAHTNIVANRYTPGAGWGTATLIVTNNLVGAANPQVALDGSGNGMAVWEQYAGTMANIMANRYSVGTGWGTPALLETTDTGDALHAEIAFDATGNALAVWQQSNGLRTNAWSNRYTSGSGWGTALRLEPDAGGNTYDPQIAIGPSGNALAVWNKFDDLGRDYLWFNRFQ